MIKILMLAERGSANTSNWVDGLTRYGGAQVEVWSLPNVSFWIRFLYIPLAILAVRRKIKTFHPDILVGYRTTSYGFIAAMSKFNPLVLAAQGESDVWPPGHWSNVVSLAMAKHSIRHASLIHAWGKNMVPSLMSHGASANQILVMPRGIDVSRFHFSIPFKQPKQVSLVVSRALYPEYHHALLLNAFARVVRSLPEVKCQLIIAGDGPLRGALSQQCIVLGISNLVTFTGKVNAELLNRYLQVSDIYISLPETEGLSSSLLEAMASGCFPIVTDLPANREVIVNGENGQLVALQEDEIERAIISVWNTPEAAKRIALSNRILIESYADSRINSVNFVEKYRDLIQKFKKERLE